MALAPLATAADLSARGVDISNTTRINALLDSASAAVRDAAGCAISQLTSTVALQAPASQRLMLPGAPVTAVSSVVLDGVTLTVTTDYVLRASALWRVGAEWQQPAAAPSEVVVTYTHGLAAVPADIVDLVCSLVAGGLAAASQAYDPNRALAYERIDDYQRGFRQGDDEVVNPMILPERTRQWLRSRFGSGVVVTGSVR